MLAVSCLQVAAKYEEAEENVPAVTQLSQASGMGLTIQTVQRWEVAVLEGLGWQLTCIVPLHFLDYYLTRGLLFQGEFLRGRPLPPLRPPASASASASASQPGTPAGVSGGGKGVSPIHNGNGNGGGPSAAAAQQLRKYTHFFAQHLAVHEYGATGTLPSSFLAALVAYLARVVVGVTPAWRPELVALTGCEEAQLSPLAQHVLRSYREAYPQHHHKHGQAAAAGASAAAAAAGATGGLSFGAFGVFGSSSSAPAPLPLAAAALGPAGRANGGGGGGGGSSHFVPSMSMSIPDPPAFDYQWIGRGVPATV